MRRMKPTTLRSDALRSRQAILAAARELYAATGDVPMYEVAKRAGVGQATLYRHFPDRVALAVTLAEEVVVDLELVAQRHGDDPDAFYVLLASIVNVMVSFRGLVEVVRSPAVAQPEADRLKERLLALFAGPLDVARSAGTVRANLQVEDVIVIFAMVEGGLREVADVAQRPRLAEWMIEIITGGVATGRT